MRHMSMKVTRAPSGDGESRTLKYQRLVVKAGTGVLTGGGDQLDLEVMSGLVGQIAELRALGVEVILVTSGAVAAGKHTLGLSREPEGYSIPPGAGRSGAGPPAARV